MTKRQFDKLKKTDRPTGRHNQNTLFEAKSVSFKDGAKISINILYSARCFIIKKMDRWTDRRTQ